MEKNKILAERKKCGCEGCYYNTDDDIALLEEMRQNCLIKRDYIDVKAERKAKAIENFIKRYRELEIENQSYRDYLGEPPCYDNASYIPKSKIKELLRELNNEYKKSEEVFNKHFEKESKDMQDYYIQKEATTVMQLISWVIETIEEMLGREEQE